jgi:hypothetical protein
MISQLIRCVAGIAVAGTMACGGGGFGEPSRSAPSALPALPAAVAPSTGVGPTAGGRVTRLSGSLSSLAGACPSVTFSVDATAVSTTPGTHFVGATCAQLANGATVGVDGILQSGSVAATDVRSEVPVARVHGTIAALGGTCPAVTFTVDGTAVSTTGSTRFAGATCTQLADGETVDVEGFLENGAVAAERVTRPGDRY